VKQQEPRHGSAASSSLNHRRIGARVGASFCPEAGGPKIGVLWHAGTPEEEAIYAEPLRRGFSDLGYVEGRDYELIETYAAEKYERFNANAAKLVEAKVDVIVAVTGPAAAAAQRATTTVPIVFVVVPDPVGRKFAQSLSHPGGNLTGLSTASVDLGAKQLEHLREAIPGLSRISLFVNAKDAPMSRSIWERTRSAGTALNVSVEVVEISDPEELDGAFAEVGRQGVKAAILMQDPLFFNERKRIARLGLAHGVATMVANSVMVGDGCLMSYGPSSATQFRRVGAYVDKILKGRRPGEIPIEEPTRLALVVNLKTAAALGLAIPTSLLAQAGEVIE
jgi:putative tryptophan/tyrosine transport system substrate-binding protein